MIKQKSIEHEKLQKEIARLSSFEPELEQAENQIKQLESQLTPVKARAQKLSDYSNGQEKRIRELSILEKQLPQTEYKLTQANERIEKLETQLAPLKTQAEVDAATMVDLRSRLEALASVEKQLNESQNKVTALSSQIDQQLADAIALQTLKQENEQLQNENQSISELQQSIKDERKISSQHSAETENLKQLLLKSRSETEILAKSTREQTQNVKQLEQVQQKELNSLNNKLAQAQQAQRQSQDQVIELKAKLDNTSSVHQELVKVESIAARQRDEIARLRDRLPQLENQLAEKNQQQDKLIALEHKIKERDTTLARLQSELETASDLELKLQHLVEENRKINLLERQIIERDKQIMQFSNEVESLHKAKDKELIRQESEKLQELQQKIKERDNTITELTTKAATVTKLESKLADHENTSEKLHTSTKQLKERESALAQLTGELAQQKTLAQDHLNRFETQGKQLLHKQQQLEKTRQNLEQHQKQLSSLRQQLSQQSSKQRTGATAEVQHTDSQSDDESNVTDLRKQVKSLTTERDLGLQRVKELSDSARQLTERDKQLKQLKLELADDRIRSRDFSVLQTKVNKYEHELQSKNLAIEELKKLLRAQQQRPNKKTVAKGPLVKKTANVNSATANSTIANTKPIGKDDLKKIHGIGPVLEKLLNDQGITSFQQIVNLSSNDIKHLEENIISFSGRIERDDWIGGAKIEYKKKYG